MIRTKTKEYFVRRHLCIRSMSYQFDTIMYLFIDTTHKLNLKCIDILISQ